ncbi:hypothetical protein J7382_11965 [Shimia sp. R11_0]|uniref:hypothetical protein n=1 Tax=Shimia sp. R11_0 TaxID=2821096 RepID=UPI001ADC6434|nr:hypothetical protein [Shimia sp. R11_0]MBO9478252.1 hypothetical protein [Shimia sp. R11_0]
MTPDLQMPPTPHATATDAEWRAYLGELLELVSKQGVPALKLQGFTEPELFQLRRLASVFRNGQGTAKDLRLLRAIAEKL